MVGWGSRGWGWVERLRGVGFLIFAVRMILKSGGRCRFFCYQNYYICAFRVRSLTGALSMGGFGRRDFFSSDAVGS